MYADNGSERYDFDLSALKFMAFSSDSNGVENVFDNAGTVSVYTVAGAETGVFSSAEEAIRSLDSGVYLFKCGNAVHKIIVP